jgi:integrase
MAEFGPVWIVFGQRLADIAALTWDNLDLSKNEIRLRTRKTAKRIMVPIAKPLRQHIDSLPAGFQPGTPIHPKAFKIINRHGRSANLSKQLPIRKSLAIGDSLRLSFFYGDTLRFIHPHNCSSMSCTQNV